MNFDEAYVLLRPQLIRFIQRHVKNQDDVEDIAQDTYLKAKRRDVIGEIRHSEIEPTWCYIRNTAINLIKDRARSIRRHPTLSLDHEYPALHPCDGDKEVATFEDVLLHYRPDIMRSHDETHRPIEDKELCDIVREAVKKLPEHQRFPVVMTDMHEKSLRQVSQETGVCEGTIKSRSCRGRNVLRRKLKKYVQD